MRAGLLALICAALTARAAWTEAAWPACAHVGGREIAPGLLYKQVWARELFRAIDERAQAVHAAGVAGVWTGLPTLPAWWTEGGVTNQVVRYDREVLVWCKRLAGALVPYFLNPALVDPEELPASWHAHQVATGARATNLVASATFTAWVWECPAVEHEAFFAYFDMARLGSGTAYAAPALLAQAQRPAAFFTVSPYRLLEGLCDPDDATTAPRHVLALDDQGTSPHDSGLWYWTDLGWDGVRDVLGLLRHQVNPAGLTAGWWWNEEDGPDQTNLIGFSETETYTDPGGVDSVLTSGSFAAALAAQAEGGPVSVSGAAPYWTYMHAFYSDERALNTVWSCAWKTTFEGRRGRPQVARSRTWPPAAVTAALRFDCDVRRLALGDRHYVESWTTEAVDAQTVSSGASTLQWTAVAGTVSPDEDDRPGDPAGSRLSPAHWQLDDAEWGLGGSDSPSGEDDDDYHTADLRRGNKVRALKIWDTPVLTATYTWTYP